MAITEEGGPHTLSSPEGEAGAELGAGGLHSDSTRHGWAVYIFEQNSSSRGCVLTGGISGKLLRKALAQRRNVSTFILPALHIHGPCALHSTIFQIETFGGEIATSVLSMCRLFSHRSLNTIQQISTLRLRSMRR